MFWCPCTHRALPRCPWARHEPTKSSHGALRWPCLCLYVPLLWGQEKDHSLVVDLYLKFAACLNTTITKCKQPPTSTTSTNTAGDKKKSLKYLSDCVSFKPAALCKGAIKLFHNCVSWYCHHTHAKRINRAKQTCCSGCRSSDFCVSCANNWASWFHPSCFLLLSALFMLVLFVYLFFLSAHAVIDLFVMFSHPVSKLASVDLTGNLSLFMMSIFYPNFALAI